ncbi:hypothetical protein Pint_27573 [Pistacia integerrima]|uniref:Uncharacterized protein n=1 Tax=Pistacia integerrima TaxID=434235 RepID=A0ACC0YSS6_9ROSI|nr:hypothetical protein Pint_27573 [Pistacia integerrima]
MKRIRISYRTSTRMQTYYTGWRTSKSWLMMCRRYCMRLLSPERVHKNKPK